MKQILYPIFFVYFLSSCGSQKVVTTKYYVIEVERDSIAVMDVESDPIIDKYCEIDQAEVYPAYASSQIANRSAEMELTYYAHHQWAIRPAESFTRMVEDYFNHVPVFKNTSGRFWKVDPAYRIETTVFHLEVIQENNAFVAHLDMEFILRETEQGKVIVQHQANEKRALADKDLNLLASAVAEIFHAELIRFSEKIVRKTREAN
jgi:ABC-type uncharacterized transport system auxiliary subunit